MFRLRHSTSVLLLVAGLLAAAVFPAAAADAANPTAFLVYYDDDFELEVFDSSGDYMGDIYLGMELFPGTTIKTYGTTAEIQLDPNGSILKISENSVFQIEAFQRTADESNDFSLFNGKLRVIAARAGLGNENYSIITQSAVCGVRGTDFVIDSIGVLAVRDGEVAYSNLLSGDTISVSTGQIADVFADTFAAVSATAEQLSSIFSPMSFKGADPAQVPGHNPEPAAPAGEDEQAEKEDADEPAEKAEEAPAPPAEKAGAGSVAAGITGQPAASRQASAEKKEAPAPAQPGPFDDFFAGLGDLLGFQIGSVNMGGETWAKAVIQPRFEIGSLKVGLYLPIIYQNNLFNPETWYKPAGNNEWSFGTDQNGVLNIISDVAGDLFLKIQYIQWGDNGDDFYLKFGNLNNMTIGHGILMYNYANDSEFPSIRKVGLNTGLNFDYFGLEAVVDNAAAPSIFGGRMIYRPFGTGFPLGVALSGITDINPDSEIETSPVLWDPMILNASFDIELPVKPLGFTLFADTAAMVPYVNGSWHTEMFYNPAATAFLDRLNNYGISAGILGSLFSLDYRVEYRLTKGIFRTAFYNSGYDRGKTAYYNEITSFLSDPYNEAYSQMTMGVFGELSMNLFDIVTITGGYLWPWTVSESGIGLSEEDYLHLSAALQPGVIPVVGIYGSVSYTRTNFADSIRKAAAGTQAFQLFDQATIFKGELVYPFDKSLDIALGFSTALTRNDEGKISLDADGNPDVYYAFTIDTRLHF